MALTMRPAGLSSGIDQDRADYTVFCGEWNISRIYEVRGGPEHLRWFWALHFPSKPEGLRTDNRVATLEVAKVEFEASWRQWLAWAKLGEVDRVTRPPTRAAINDGTFAMRPKATIDSETQNRWILGETLDGVTFRMGQPVRIASGSDAGVTGILISLCSLPADPLFHIETWDGGDRCARQSELVPDATAQWNKSTGKWDY
jgi:hypothetical protein